MAKRSKVERIYGGLDRVAGFVRANVKVARVTDQLAGIARQQIQIPLSARGLALKAGQRPEIESIRSGIERHAGSETGSGRNRARGQLGNFSKSMSADATLAIDRFGSNVKALETAVRVRERLDRVRRTSGVERHANLSGAKSFQQNSDHESRGPEADATIDSTGRFSRLIQQSSPGIKPLKRIQNSGRRFSAGNDLNSARTSPSSGAARSDSGSTRSWGELAGRANRTLGSIG